MLLFCRCNYHIFYVHLWGLVNKNAFKPEADFLLELAEKSGKELATLSSLSSASYTTTMTTVVAHAHV
jgi:hypothetical protein